VVVAFATAIVLSLGGWRVLTGVLTPGDLVIFLTYMKASMKPLRDLAKYTGRIAKASAAGERVVDLLETDPEIVDRPGARPAPRLRGELELEGVHLAYRPGRWALQRVDLHIAAGETVALIGPSGGGKSSLASLLLRLIEPTRGRILYDGADAEEITVRQPARAGVGRAPGAGPVRGFDPGEHPLRSPGCDRRGDRAGGPGRERARVHHRACRRGYDHVIEERGASLSGGQRQRIALARAMLRDAPIVVLDEATSSVDPDNQREIQDAIARLTADRTTIVITHDRTSIVDCDRVLWVEDGRVHEHPPAPPESREVHVAAG
jgi:ATP-binding cassette, subfamily B, bacterial